MSINGPPRNYYEVLKEYSIGHVLKKQNKGSTLNLGDLNIIWTLIHIYDLGLTWVLFGFIDYWILVL